jgi:hypothetical protein
MHPSKLNEGGRRGVDMPISRTCKYMSFMIAVGTITTVAVPTVARATPASQHKNRRSSTADIQRSTLESGLYVNGLNLTGGVSIDKVKGKLGADDERYGKPGKVSYVWKLKDGSVLTAEFDSIGSLQRATLATGDTKRLNGRTFSVIDGWRIVPGKTTFGALRKLLKRGQLGKTWSAENMTFLDYSVPFGGEGSEVMRFGISWIGLSDQGKTVNKTITQRDRLKIETIEVGFRSGD